jgi:hypothetical protein
MGLTVATGSREKHMIRKPIHAFQNPIVDHGSVAAKRARKAMALALLGGTAVAASHRTAPIVTPAVTATRARRRASEGAPVNAATAGV